MIDLVLYTRRDCCLCDEMKGTVEEASRGFSTRLSLIDVDSRPELAAAFGEEVPEETAARLLSCNHLGRSRPHLRGHDDRTVAACEGVDRRFRPRAGRWHFGDGVLVGDLDVDVAAIEVARRAAWPQGPALTGIFPARIGCGEPRFLLSPWPSALSPAPHAHKTLKLAA